MLGRQHPQQWNCRITPVLASISTTARCAVCCQICRLQWISHCQARRKCRHYPAPASHRVCQRLQPSVCWLWWLLTHQLIQGWQAVNRNQQEAVLSTELFNRLSSVALIDKYQAYQYLNNQWQVISSDLEMMQTEGFIATKQVDANIVIKKKMAKILKFKMLMRLGKVTSCPLDLVQQTYLSGLDLAALAKQETRCCR